MNAAQPADFGFGEDETMLRDSARRFFADNLRADRLHALVAGESDPERDNDCRWDPDLWQQVCELGWTAACIPEAAGGVGMPLVAAIAVIEEAGRAAFPAPLQVTLMSSLILRSCQTEGAHQALERIVGGEPVTFAVSSAAGTATFGTSDVRVDGSGRLTGAAGFVQDLRKSRAAVVSATGEAGVGLYLVQLDSEGVEIAADRINDLTRDQGTLLLNGAPALEVAAQGQASTAVNAALPGILSLAAADMVGTGEWLLQTTVEYVKTRTQFDRPLGFFQAIKHPLVNVTVEIDNARSLTYNAACAVDVAADNALRFARMAKAQANEMAVFSASRAVQFHGGIGFTWESFVQLFFKRQMHSQVWLGDAAWHRARLADEMIGPRS